MILNVLINIKIPKSKNSQQSMKPLFHCKRMTDKEAISLVPRVHWSYTGTSKTRKKDSYFLFWHICQMHQLLDISMFIFLKSTLTVQVPYRCKPMEFKKKQWKNILGVANLQVISIFSNLRILDGCHAIDTKLVFW